MKQSYPLVATTTQAAVADNLPVVGVNFPLGNDLAGGIVLVPIPSGCGVPEELGKVALDSAGVVTLSQTRRVMQTAVPEEGRNTAEGGQWGECCCSRDRLQEGRATARGGQ